MKIINHYNKKTLRKTTKIVAGLTLLFLCVSCEDFFLSEVTNLDLEGTEPQLVVNSFISPQDSIIKVYLSWSDPYIDNSVGSKPATSTFDVFLAKENGAEVKLEYINPGHFAYPVSQFPILTNEIYLLRVEGENGMQAQASCFVPDFSANDPVISPILITTDQWGYSTANIEWQFQATNTGPEKYYRTGAIKKMYSFFRNENNQIESYGPNYYELDIEKGNPIFADNDGNIYSFRARDWSYYPGFQTDPEQLYYWNVDSIFVYLIESDFPYYRFHKSVNDYRFYGDDNPFAETVLIYSNISNGLGTFGGYNMRNYFVGTNNPEQ